MTSFKKHFLWNPGLMSDLVSLPEVEIQILWSLLAAFTFYKGLLAALLTSRDHPAMKMKKIQECASLIYLIMTRYFPKHIMGSGWLLTKACCPVVQQSMISCTGSCSWITLWLHFVTRTLFSAHLSLWDFHSKVLPMHKLHMPNKISETAHQSRSDTVPQQHRGWGATGLVQEWFCIQVSILKKRYASVTNSSNIDRSSICIQDMALCNLRTWVFALMDFWPS